MKDKKIDTKLTNLIKAAGLLLIIQIVLLLSGNGEAQSQLMLAGFWQDLTATYLIPLVSFGVILDRLIKIKRTVNVDVSTMAWWQRIVLYGGIASSILISLLYSLFLFGASVAFNML